MNKSKFTVEEIIDSLLKENDNETIEGQLLKPKLIRELYKQLGTPSEEDFGKEMEPAGTYFEKGRGYTKDIQIIGSEEHIRAYNVSPNIWQIKKASDTKERIVKNYNDNGWHATIQAYNVICAKYVKHPRYKNLAVFFYSSRDVNRYEYVLIERDGE